LQFFSLTRNIALVRNDHVADRIETGKDEYDRSNKIDAGKAKIECIKIMRVKKQPKIITDIHEQETNCSQGECSNYIGCLLQEKEREYKIKQQEHGDARIQGGSIYDEEHRGKKEERDRCSYVHFFEIHTYAHR
jgi:hypothetical protein